MADLVAEEDEDSRRRRWVLSREQRLTSMEVLPEGYLAANVSAPRPGGPGGLGVHDSERSIALIDLNSVRSRIAFDRIVADCGRFPYRFGSCINAGSDSGSMTRQ